MRADDRSHVPDLMLEQYRLNELPAAEAGRLEHRLLNDPSLQSRLHALATSDAEIARTFSSEWLAQRIRARVSAAPPAPHGLGRRLALGSAYAIVVLALLVPLSMTTSEGEPLNTRLRRYSVRNHREQPERCGHDAMSRLHGLTSF